ncbi:MAG: SDR family oxidoreductase, partial [Dehalococcoidia bacterium]
LVTGATGTVGSAAIADLKARGVSVRALIRDESKAPGLRDAGIEVVVGDLEQPHTLDNAFQGVDKVLLITPPNPNQVIQGKNGIQAAQRTSRPFVVRLSAGAVKGMPGALPRVSGQHAETDGLLKASGLPYNIIRPHFFMQNTMMAAQTVLSEGNVYMAMEGGKIGMIDVRDIVDVAVKVLTEEGHEGKTYDLTGPASISFHDVAAALSQALGRQVNYVNVPPEAARQGMISIGLPEWVADALGEYTEAFSEGYGDFTTPDVEKVTGNPPRSYETFARDFASVFTAVQAA